MIRKAVLLVALALLFSGCGGPGAKITSVKYVDSIISGGVALSYEGQDIVEMTLDFTFDAGRAPGNIDKSSDEYRDELFSILAEGAHFYSDGQEVEFTQGFWPQEAGSDYAKEMTLYYVVPSSHSVESLRFVYDGSVLGDGASSIDTGIKPS